MKGKFWSVLLALSLVAGSAAPALAADGERSVKAHFDLGDCWYNIAEDGSVASGKYGEEGALVEALPEGMSYELGTNTLTLDGVNLSGLIIGYKGVDKRGNAWQSLPDPDLTIVLKGENSVSGTRRDMYNVFDIGEGANVVLKGDGTLTVSGAYRKTDEWTGAAIRVESGCSLTIAEKARVIARATGDSSLADEWGTGVRAVDGAEISSLTVRDEAVLEAYSNDFGIASLDVTVRDSARVRTNSIQVSRELKDRDGGDMPRALLTVKDEAVVEVDSRLSLNDKGVKRDVFSLGRGCGVALEGGTLSVNLDTEMVGFEAQTGEDSAAKVAFAAYDWSEDKSGPANTVLVRGGELKVTSGDIGLQSSSLKFVQTGGRVDISGKYYGVMSYGTSIYELSGGSFQTAATGSEAEYEKNHITGVAMRLGGPQSSLTVTGGQHSFGTEAAADNGHAVGLSAVIAPVAFRGGSVSLYGGDNAIQFAIDNEAAEKLGLDEDALNRVSIGDGMAATSLTGGKELAFGRSDVEVKEKDEDGREVTTAHSFFSLTEDGSGTLADDGTGMWSNAAHAVRVAAVSAGIDPEEQGTAYASPSKVTVDGREVEFQMYALKDGKGTTNYIKLRDLADVLNDTEARFNVTWTGNIELKMGTAYTDRDGTENKSSFKGDQSYVKCTSAITVDGRPVELNAFTLTDAHGNGSNYFKLRDLGRVLGFQVDWSAEKGICVETR